MNLSNRITLNLYSVHKLLITTFTLKSETNKNSNFEKEQVKSGFIDVRVQWCWPTFLYGSRKEIANTFIPKQWLWRVYRRNSHLQYFRCDISFLGICLNSYKSSGNIKMIHEKMEIKYCSYILTPSEVKNHSIMLRSFCKMLCKIRHHIKM